MDIIALPILRDNYVWMIQNHRNAAIIIDPGDALPIIDYLTKKRLSLEAIFITHHHADHTAGIEELMPLYHPLLIQNPDITLKKQGITLPDFPHFSIMDIPGHTLTHIAYYTPGHLFCGDTLFSAGCGRLFEGTMEMLFNSLQAITTLPDDTLIYPTHEYTLKNLQFAAMIEPGNVEIERTLEQVTLLRQQNKPSLPTRLSKEKAINPFLRCKEQSVINHLRQHTGHTLDTPQAVFTALRRLKDSF